MAIPVNTMTGIEAMGVMADIGQKEASMAESLSRTKNNYADLQLKFQDIQEREMELDVLEVEQESRLAEAELNVKRSVNLLNKSGQITENDARKISEQTINSMTNLQDQQRQILASMADNVVDAQSNTIAYNQANEILSTIGKKPEDFGITKEWKGEESIDKWQFNKNAALASQQFMQTERLESDKYRRTQERDETLNEYDLERQYRQFMYDYTLQQNKLRTDLDEARIRAAAASKGALKRTDADNLQPKEIIGLSSVRIKYVLEKANFLDPNEEKIKRYTSEIATKVKETSDAEWQRYKIKGIPPRSEHTIMEQELLNFVGRVGTDGNVYPENSKELDRQKQAWISKYVEKPEPRALFDAQGFSEYQRRAVAEMAWQDVDSRDW